MCDEPSIRSNGAEVNKASGQRRGLGRPGMGAMREEASPNALPVACTLWSRDHWEVLAAWMPKLADLARSDEAAHIAENEAFVAIQHM